LSAPSSAHSIHRDLKPQNLFLTRRAGFEPRVVLHVRTSPENTMQNATMRAAWVARDGRRIAAVIDMPPETLERPLTELVVERCTACGVLGVATHPTASGPRCSLCEVS